jgi:predicted secreted acid phosphatase
MFTKYGITAAALIGCLSSPSAMAFPASEAKLHPEEEKQYSAPVGLAFSHTAAYKKEFRSAIADARKAASKFVGQPNVAIVFDIDETLIDNRGFFETHEKFTWTEFNKWIEEAKAPALKESAAFLSWARKNGFAIFLITGRMEKDRRGTIKNLVRTGIAYDGLYMRPNGDESSAAQSIKTPHREAIEKMGFKIVVNIGDQWSDLTGGHAEDCEKLPNKMYYVD